MKIISHLSSPNFDSSRQFYKVFNFKTLHEDELGEYISDGKYIFLINKNRKGRNGLICYVEDIEKYTSIYNSIYDSEHDGTFIQDPNGIRILLKPLDDYPLLDSFDKSLSTFGNPFGMGIETIDIEESIKFWKELGFIPPEGAPISNGYIGLKNQNFELTLYRYGVCPHSFNNPSYTYFNGKEANPIIIKKIRESGITISEEIDIFNNNNFIDNVIMKDPGGTGFFIFND